MLTHLEVRDLAIVEQVSLELVPGMTVLTGETGAGKSILLDALGLVLGDRAGGGIVRPGAERADIVAVFETRELPAVEARLAELELTDPDGTCVLRRTVGLDGRSRAFVNGRPVPVQGLREIGERLVDIHGQHAHQALLRRDAQREVLDHFAGQEARLAELRGVWQGWQAAREAAARLGGSAAERSAAHELLRYQVDELRGLGLQPGEVEAIGAEHRRLTHAGALLATARRAAHALEEAEEGAVVPRLETLARELAETARFDDRLTPLAELLDGAAIQAREAAGGLRRYADADELDPDRLQWLEQRIAAVEALARKHRVPAAELSAHLERLEQRLAELERGDERLAALEAEIAAHRQRYEALAGGLHDARFAAAPRLAEAIVANVRELGMAGARFAVEVQPTPTTEPGPTGWDRVEFLVSANPGQPLGPLAQVASGGELSRISLAIQLIGATRRAVPTQVFDEVDSGVGGRVGEVVGSALRRLAGACQVLCVTHLPQVAARGHHHLEVRKGVRDGATFATVTPLGGDTRVQELARMLGGLEVTERALAHAREMLERASCD